MFPKIGGKPPKYQLPTVENLFQQPHWWDSSTVPAWWPVTRLMLQEIRWEKPLESPINLHLPLESWEGDNPNYKGVLVQKNNDVFSNDAWLLPRYSMKVTTCRWHGYPISLLEGFHICITKNAENPKPACNSWLFNLGQSRLWGSNRRISTKKKRSRSVMTWWDFSRSFGFLAKKERIIWTKQWFFRGKLFLTFRVIWGHFGVWQVLGTQTRFDCWTLGDSRIFFWKTRKRNHKNWNFPFFDALKNPISVDIRVTDRHIFVTNLLGGLRPNLDGLLEYIRADTQPFASSVFVGRILHSKPPELRQTCLRMHGWMDGRTDGPTDRRMDGWNG